jgi:hypothetical protein
MWVWVDGHMVLLAVAAWPVSWLVVVLVNKVLQVRHARQRAAIFAKRGA